MGKSRVGKVKYSIEVYDDQAIIRGWIESDVLALLVGLCRHEGFTHMTSIDDGSQGLKLFRHK